MSRSEMLQLLSTGRQEGTRNILRNLKKTLYSNEKLLQLGLKIIIVSLKRGEHVAQII